MLHCRQNFQYIDFFIQSDMSMNQDFYIILIVALQYFDFDKALRFFKWA